MRTIGSPLIASDIGDNTKASLKEFESMGWKCSLRAHPRYTKHNIENMLPHRHTRLYIEWAIQ
ncbi:hypothetical protein MGG_16506 [Pyricularia oryzae 70-15]|uniref:Uncharacterized protein n=1 Tax=Pyricularia oryzae (strain 70-15 / ATCC MYA-4617 / FGSC 8958) TaxID=242507 RepID=G4MRB8_PYRO7|nr:uncharacterized protein MGG_16506 [Pyricularia oryzae 70-15]EHA58243.1 hypothetical protein MGG_16506 [Pyricularia oryzae 70-15]